MQTIKALKDQFHEDLNLQYTASEIDFIFYTLAQLYLQKDKSIIRMGLNEHWDKLSQTGILFQTALIRLKTGEPYQYVINQAEFYGLNLFVDNSVLIPRPETEEMVDWIVKDLSIFENFNGNILDIGTGSGAIALALKSKFPNTSVYALDKSEVALKVAKKNAEILNLNLNFIHADIFEDSLKDLPYFEIIVSNPPYIAEKEKAEMNKTVTEFEPASALFVPDENPLLFYDKIVDIVLAKRKPRGRVYVEFNQNLKDETVHIFEDVLPKVEARKDISGNWRFLKADGTFACT